MYHNNIKKLFDDNLPICIYIIIRVLTALGILKSSEKCFGKERNHRLWM